MTCSNNNCFLFERVSWFSSSLRVAHARVLLVALLGVGAAENDFLLLLDESAAAAEEGAEAILDEGLGDVVLGLDVTGVHLEELLKMGLGDAIFGTELITLLGLDEELGSEAAETAVDQALCIVSVTYTIAHMA
jgi:hypothetical protein